jgi:hypothetical protein
LLVLLTGADSLLVAPEGPLLLLLELSAAVVAVVLFLRGTGFKFGLTGAVSCASGAAKVRLVLSLLHTGGGHVKGIELSEVNEGHRKQRMCVCVCVFVCPYNSRQTLY